MKCQVVLRDLSQYLENELPAERRGAIARHLEACASCRAEVEVFLAAERALESLSATETAPELLGDLRRRLATPPARSMRWAWAGLAAVAVAAWVVWPKAGEKRVVSPMPKPVTPRVEVSRPAPPVVAAAPAPAVKPAPVRTAKYGARQERKLGACATVVKAGVGTPALQTHPAGSGDPALQASAVPATEGIILILGDPIPPVRESRCHLELTLADGTRSVYERNTKPGENGQPSTIAIVYEQSAPGIASDN